MVTTDDAGNYEATVWRPGSYVAEINLDARSEVRFVEPNVEIDDDRMIDFHIPNNGLRIEVTDSVTGKGIAEASVWAESVWENTGRGEMRMALPFKADQGGRLFLSGVHPGSVKLVAEAPGYVKSAPVFQEIASDTQRRVSIPLDPIRKRRQARITFPLVSPRRGRKQQSS